MAAILFNALIWSFIGQTIAFSIGILLIGRTSKSSSLWLLANAFTVTAVTQMAFHAEGFGGTVPSSSVILNLIALSLRGWSLGHGRLSSRRNLPATTLTVLSLGLAGLFAAFPNTDFRALIICISALFAVIASHIYLNTNRAWRGLSGQEQMQAIYVMLVAILFLQLIKAYPFGPNIHFFGNSTFQIVGAALMVALSFFWQIVYINLIVGRQARVRLQAEKRSSRIQERTRLLAASNQTIQRLASERLNLIKMMTHEVRQPLNNAQAALQTVMNEMTAAPLNPERATQAATRVQLILDEVTLALSNSIVAASIIEWKKNPTMLALGAGETLALAAMDCSSTEAGRLVIEQPDDEIYLHADPVLMRLALRNLLSNALKYSPPGSPVRVSIALDEARYGITFRCTNAVEDARLLLGDLFSRGKRGMDNSYEGYGLGLFMVNETARIHHGELTYWQASPGEVTFELLLPL